MIIKPSQNVKIVNFLFKLNNLSHRFRSKVVGNVNSANMGGGSNLSTEEIRYLEKQRQGLNFMNESIIPLFQNKVSF